MGVAEIIDKSTILMRSTLSSLYHYEFCAGACDCAKINLTIMSRNIYSSYGKSVNARRWSCLTTACHHKPENKHGNGKKHHDGKIFDYSVTHITCGTDNAYIANLQIIL